MNQYKVMTFLALSALLVAAPSFALTAIDPWDAAAREGLAIHIKVWLGLMLLNNLAALAFVKNYVAPRWVFGGWFVSHATSLTLALQGFEVLVGHISILHILCWTPGAVVLVLRRNEIRTGSTAYSIWASLAIMFFFVSMIFDLRDATIYLAHVFGW